MDKQYFYTDGREKFGPFSLDQLKQQNIHRNTLVWTEGMGDWAPASTLPELKDMLAETPPPVPEEGPATNYSQSAYANNSGSGSSQMGPKPSNYMVQSILVLLFCCWPFAIPALVAASKVDSAYAAGDYQGAIKASDDARKWVTVSFVLGLVGGIFFFIVMMATDGFR